MPLWLFKTEPSTYSFADLERDVATNWDGVSNPLALKHLRSCKPGDRAFFYHTGTEKAVVGIMEIVGEAVSEPDDGKKVTLPVKAVRRLAIPVTLADIKADDRFADWELVKQSRLSVMPCTAARWKLIEQMAAGK